MGMAKYDRLLHILNLLRARKNLNAAKLAEECGVTERSIYRDMIALSEANVPIYYDNGYKLASDNFLPPFNFDFDEYCCLRLALESTPLKATDKYSKLINQIQAKIEAGLSEKVKNEKKISTAATHIDIPTAVDRINDEDYYAIIEDGVSNWQCLEIEYESINSGRSVRIVEPYFIIFKGKAFYFVAWCRKRDEFRTFRVDRVKNIKLLDEKFIRKSGINPETYFEDSWQVYSGRPVEIVIEFNGKAANIILSSTHHSNELVEKTDEGKVIYRITTLGFEEIQRWILGFGDEAEVIEPIELREALAEIGGDFVKKYVP